MSAGPPTWLQEANALPLGFAQVREDPAIDQLVVNRIAAGARIVMVASGGCTAAALASSPNVESIHLVDPNAAQIALARLKLRLLATAAPGERLALLGHAAMPALERARALAEQLAAVGLSSDSLGPPEMVATLGPDHAGRYERLFAALQQRLRPHTAAIDALLALSDPAEQAKRADPVTPLGAALDRGFEEIFALETLVALFGEAATRNPREPFSTHFARRLRAVLGSQPAAGNPFLGQMLAGRFAPGAEHAWLTMSRPGRLPKLTWATTPMVAALRERRGDCDFVHLSNILDWLTPEAATETLGLAREALRPGGWLLIRQLNSVLDIPSLETGIEWLARDGSDLLARDRSFFYRALHLGRRS